MYLDRVKAYFAEVNARVHLADGVTPCTEREVTDLEEKLGLQVPDAYKEFLLWMGHGAGNFLRGTDCFYDSLPLNEAACELLTEDNVTLQLPEDAFVFYMHQDYQFMFLRTSEGPNPPVYFYAEESRDKGFQTLYESFSDFLATEIDGHERLFLEMGRANR